MGAVATQTPAWLGGVSSRVRLLVAPATPTVALGDFRCRPGDPAWDEPNDVGAVHHLVFPGTPVEITHDGGDPSTVDATQVVLHQPDRPYRRRIIDPRGDRCTFLALGAETIDAMRRDASSSAVDDALASRRTSLPVGPGLLLRLQVLRQTARRGALDELAVELELVDLAALVVVGGRPEPPDAARSAATAAHQRRLVEDTRAWIAVHHAQRWQLGDVAAAVHASPFHLHRTFRQLTGTTILAYRDRLRLATSLERVLDGEDLATIAEDLGFANHSHFTARFRRGFGCTPSAARRAGRSRARS